MDLFGETFRAVAAATVQIGEQHKKRLIMIGTANNHVYVS